MKTFVRWLAMLLGIPAGHDSKEEPEPLEAPTRWRGIDSGYQDPKSSSQPRTVHRSNSSEGGPPWEE